MSAVIEPALKENEDGVFVLAQTFPSPTVIDRESFSITWSVKLKDENACTLVARMDSEIIGYAAGYAHRPFYANGPTFWLDEILVRDDWRRKGVGEKLLFAVEERAIQQNCKQILLASSKMGGFYQEYGFENTAQYYKKYL